MHQGSCLCGGVRFTLDAPLTQIGMCHCRMCRKSSGTAFATNTPVPASAFMIVQGRELLSGYESSPGKRRWFCSRCGSPVYSESARLPGIVRLRLGTFDTPAGRRPDFHFFVEDQADWYALPDDGLPRHRGFEPGRSS